MGRKLLVRAH